MNAIQWSEQLDRIFVTNYESDPSLGWQYFGSSTGFMRQYPGNYALNNQLIAYQLTLMANQFMTFHFSIPFATIL